MYFMWYLLFVLAGGMGILTSVEFHNFLFPVGQFLFGINWLDSYFFYFSQVTIIVITFGALFLLTRGGVIHGSHGDIHPWIDRIAPYTILPVTRRVFSYWGYRAPHSSFTKSKKEELRKKLLDNEKVYILGINSGLHNAGVALVEVSLAFGVKLLYNLEEERYSGKKNACGFPYKSCEEMWRIIDKIRIETSIQPENLPFVVVLGWDISSFAAKIASVILSNCPRSFWNLFPSRSAQTFFLAELNAIYHTPKILADIWPKNLPNFLLENSVIPIVDSRHHDNHAYFSFYVSPFADSQDPVMVLVLDGQGDDCSTSFYISKWNESLKQNELKLQKHNNSPMDSLGTAYGMISSTVGGWTFLSSEGRFMGAAAYGRMCRLTNPYYKRLRQILYLKGEGDVVLNKELINWHFDLQDPYTRELVELLGPPIPQSKMWNPDAVLEVDLEKVRLNMQQNPITRDRLDKAAALQMAFEDGVFHTVEHFIRSTDGASKLVWTGGAALNCLTSMRLLENFNENYYQTYYPHRCTSTPRRLELWVPPIPSDQGVAVGAAYYFALTSGVCLKVPPLQHAFYCGVPPSQKEIEQAIKARGDMGHIVITNVNSTEPVKVENFQNTLEVVADLMAFLVKNNAVIGVYQGSGETGPRALGHRSILANACDVNTRERLNKYVKYRESVRPLAPMATLEAANELFHLSPGTENSSGEQYAAYNWMVLTALVKEEAKSKIPAVVHADGTSRVQIVREETDTLTWHYLKAMGRYVGVEVSINTSLNVGSPIVQTPEQAVDCLRRAKGMHGLFMLAREGHVNLVCQLAKDEVKDGGELLSTLLSSWTSKTKFMLPSLRN